MKQRKREELHRFDPPGVVRKMEMMQFSDRFSAKTCRLISVTIFPIDDAR